MKKVKRIVITGGPCGGKTTALEKISKTFREMGYQVILVNETATELIQDGIRPFGDSKLDLIDFQRLVLDAQLKKEAIRERSASMSRNENIIILYDRGILDNRAYLTDEEFKKIAEEENIKEADIIPRYDLVLHLVTAADGAVEYYTLSNNKARTESVEEAIRIDQKTIDSWTSHPNFRVIGNTTGFNEKINRAINYIREEVGEKEVSHEEKYLVDINGIDIASINTHLVRQEIEEFVTRYEYGENEMYRKTTIDNASYYTCTVMKNANNPTSRSTKYRVISEEEYFDKLKNSNFEPLQKVRYNFIYEKDRYRLDIYNQPNGLVILEKDITEESNNFLPKFISPKKNITGDMDYYDASIFYRNNTKGKVYEK